MTISTMVALLFVLVAIMITALEPRLSARRRFVVARRGMRIATTKP